MVESLLGDSVADAAPATEGSPAVAATEGAAPAESVAPVGSEWLPESYREHASFKDFKNVDGLCKSYDHLRSEIGRSIRIPSAEAGKEDLDKFYGRLSSVEGVMRKPDAANADAMNQFYNSLGRPESSSEYKIDLGDANANVDAAVLDSFKKVAHEAGLTESQAQTIVKFDVSRMTRQSEVDVHAATNAVSVLKNRWGNEYNNRIAGAKAALRMYKNEFPDGFADIERTSKNNPLIVAILSDIGKTMEEKGYMNAPHAYGGTSPPEAIEKIKEIRRNKQHAFNNKSDPDNALAKERMMDLYKEAYPT